MGRGGSSFRNDTPESRGWRGPALLLGSKHTLADPWRESKGGVTLCFGQLSGYIGGDGAENKGTDPGAQS